MSAVKCLRRANHFENSEKSFFHGQLTFKSLFDEKEDTPAKYQECSAHLTPILSMGIDHLVCSPPNHFDSISGAPTLNISDFEFKHLEKRVTGDLFSSAKKKYSGSHFDTIHMETCSTSSETSTAPQKVKIFECVFGDGSDESINKVFDNHSIKKRDFKDRTKLFRTKENEMNSKKTGGQAFKVRFGHFIDFIQVDKNLYGCVTILQDQIAERERETEIQIEKNKQPKSSRCKKTKRENTNFSLF